MCRTGPSSPRPRAAARSAGGSGSAWPPSRPARRPKPPAPPAPPRPRSTRTASRGHILPARSPVASTARAASSAAGWRRRRCPGRPAARRQTVGLRDTVLQTRSFTRARSRAATPATVTSGTLADGSIRAGWEIRDEPRVPIRSICTVQAKLSGRESAAEKHWPTRRAAYSPPVNLANGTAVTMPDITRGDRVEGDGGGPGDRRAGPGRAGQRRIRGIGAATVRRLAGDGGTSVSAPRVTGRQPARWRRTPSNSVATRSGPTWTSPTPPR